MSAHTAEWRMGEAMTVGVARCAAASADRSAIDCEIGQRGPAAPADGRRDD